VVTAYEDETAEAEGVAAALARRAAQGMQWSDQAVLARTHDQLAVVGRALARAGIPHRTAPGPEAAAPGVISSGGRPPGGPDRSRETELGGDDAVDLATFHRAKGLEWRSVSVIGLEDGFVPIIFAASAGARAEERRLLYVALTRAETELDCSWARSRTSGYGQKVERQPSPWLAAVEQVSTTGSARMAPDDAVRRIAQIRAGLGT
jgi:DNA helicase-2/ATP-dependent DNA helicase PcrA